MVIVNRVLPWSTSIRSGLEEGDIIWGVNGQFIGSNLLKLTEVLDANTNKRIELDIYRNGTPLKAKTFVREINQYKQRNFIKWAAVFQDISPAV